MGVEVVRVERNRAVEIHDRAIEFALIAVNHAAIVVGIGQIRLQADRLVIVADRAVRLALVVVGGPRSR